MAKKFSVGDHVRWNSEAGHVQGKIIKVHTKDVEYKGHTHRCSVDDPQYESVSRTSRDVHQRPDLLAGRSAMSTNIR